MELNTLSYEKIYEEALKYIKEESAEGTVIKSFRITKNYFDCIDYSYHIVTEYNPEGEILSLAMMKMTHSLTTTTPAIT